MMLRNQDRPELVLLVGSEAVVSSGRVRPGLGRILEEARSAGTPAVWVVHEAPASVSIDAEVFLWPSQTLRSPGTLQRARESLEIAPDAYGGSDGFGRGRSPAKRCPLAARCVVLAASVDACCAGRAAGMRVVGVGDDPSLETAADVYFADLDDPDFYCSFDDLYTPGSYWINPPVPRTLDGLHCDPETGDTLEYYGAQGDARILSSEHQIILSDLAPPPRDDDDDYST